MRLDLPSLPRTAHLLALLAAAACSRPAPPPPPGGAAGPVTLRLGYNIGSLNRELVIETGLSRGVFARHGIVLEDKGYSVGGQIAQDLAAGHLDVGLVGISPSLNAIAQGADLVIVASQTKNNTPLVVRAGIEKLADLDGKKVGNPGMSSIQETMLNHLEREHGFRTTHVYGKAPDLVGYLEKGEIDAILGWEPVAARAVETVPGARYLLDTVIPGAEASMISVSGKLLRERREVVVRFLAAMEEIRLVIISAKEERVKVAAAKLGITESAIAEGMRRSSLFVEPMRIDLPSVRLIAREDVASGKLKGLTADGVEPFLARAVDTTALEEALALSRAAPAAAPVR